MMATSEPTLAFLNREWFSSSESFDGYLNVAILLIVYEAPGVSFLLTLIMAEGLPKFLLGKTFWDSSSNDAMSEFPPPEYIVTADHTYIVDGG